MKSKYYYDHPGIFKRSLAFFLDGFASVTIFLLAYPIISILIVKIYESIYGNSEIIYDEDNITFTFTAILLFTFIFLFGPLYYVGFLVSKWQTTPGKAILNMHVVSIIGDEKISFMQALVRYCISLVSQATILPYIIAIFIREKTTLHDFLSLTRVVSGACDRVENKTSKITSYQKEQNTHIRRQLPDKLQPVKASKPRSKLPAPLDW